MNLNELEVMARAAKERADKATPGPWETYPRYRIPPGEVGAKHVIAHAPDAGIGIRDLDFVLIAPGWPTGGIPQTRLNFEQMAAARQDVPALADALLSLVERVRLLENALNEICTLGRVCEDYEMCNHPACVDSAGAYLIALDTLKKAEAESEGQGL